ncbi:Nuclear transport factor 2 (NTF2) family protein with RNA binding (RRM-RBD-RNP motifs) domain [Theobroma cacao]|uniref:Nuclear transport factor 2 (NTF2) family protein with RNA binding (RRM-RBD-RNP motifs) domain n=1 Tax=Theobroma cacao TaxID=3641 RepID=A0A061FSI8_THECC|nr:Nuclear transport factor 2 (NTF2) family protein with RNA binding (RRM-RBD-RNP motifs) domain [Theobroma cacao]
MAAAKACPLPSFTAQEVADSFVRQYYTLLCISPGELHRFYQGSGTSTVSRPAGPDGAMISFRTMEEIKKHVQSSLDCKGYDIHSCDAQFIADGGVFVLVIGRFTAQNDKTRKFNQSFLLAPMEDVNHHRFFVLNDVIRFLDEQETKTMHLGDAPAAVSTNDVPNKAVPRKSFLSMVHALSENPASFKAPPVKTSIRTPPRESNLNGKSCLEGKKNTRNVNNVRETSIFVGNLAMDSKPEDLYEAFKRFGAIKGNGVQIRTDQHNRRFAFIQFETSSSAQSAVEASSIRIGNRTLKIKEKKRNNDSGNRKTSQGFINGNGQENSRGARNFTKGNGPAKH